MKVVTSWPPYIIDGMKAHYDGQLEFWNKHVTIHVEKQLKGGSRNEGKLELDGHNEGAQAYPLKGHGVK
jgi:hypothetical protein